MILLVCGGRDYRGDVTVLYKIRQPAIVIHGNAPGADKLAAAWFKSVGIHTAAVDALWKFFKKSAGPIRNRAMAALRPTHCVAFPGGSGTLDMISICRNMNIPIWFPYRRDSSGTLSYNGDPPQCFLPIE